MANEDERAQWGGAMGAVWVRRQAELDGLMAELTTLLIARAGLGPGLRVLDLGCGAGDTTLAAARAVGPEGRVTGFDASAALLAVAADRVRDAGLGNVDLAEGDAQTDRAPGGPFDAVLSRFGVMFFADPVAAFANVAGQMRPGARLACMAWGPAAENPWFAIPARAVAARLGPSPPADPTAPGPMAFADPERVAGLLERAGLLDVRAEACDATLRHAGGPRALAALGLEVGPAARALRVGGATEADRDATRQDLERAFEPFAAPDGARVPARVLVYTARAA